MTKFNPFRVSFDRPLGDSERKRARIAATVVSATALVLGVASVSALLNASSATVAAWTNAAPGTRGPHCSRLKARIRPANPATIKRGPISSSAA